MSSAKSFGVMEHIALVAVVVGAGALFWTFQQTTRDRSESGREIPMALLPLEGLHRKGNSAARVAVVTFSDFECPFCAQFAISTQKEVEARYVDSGKVLWAFEHFPLTSIHHSALKAAEGADCAGRQGQFWQMHDLLFQRSPALSPDRLYAYANELRLDGRAFVRCLAGDVTAKIVHGRDRAQDLGVNSTPTFFIGSIVNDSKLRITDRLSGAVDTETFSAAIDNALIAQANPALR